MKYWGLDSRQITWEIPFVELIMLGASIPKTEDKEKIKDTVTGEDLFNRFKK